VVVDVAVWDEVVEVAVVVDVAVVVNWVPMSSTSASCMAAVAYTASLLAPPRRLPSESVSVPHSLSSTLTIATGLAPSSRHWALPAVAALCGASMPKNSNLSAAAEVWHWSKV
jgi:hypothetical protein